MFFKYSLPIREYFFIFHQICLEVSDLLGKLYIVGFGPGDYNHITHRAVTALKDSDYIIGYKTYVELIKDLLDSDQQIISTGMTEEVSRAQEAVRQAEAGKKVAVISSGDSGVYGMAGLIYEVLVEKGWKKDTGVEVEVIPGISAVHSCGSLLGAPIMHDSCTISLSDHLTPWNIIEKRLEAAGAADFVIALYNPKSGRRTRQIVEAQRILLKYRSPDTPVGLVKSAYRERQHMVITTLEKMLEHEIGMLTTVIIGNSSTFVYDDVMITPRGYQRKYTLNQDVQPLKPHQRLRKEAEPWSLENVSGKMERKTPLELATEAIGMVDHKPSFLIEPTNIQSIFEFAVSPGIANKKFTPAQFSLLAQIVGEEGAMEYSRDHQILLKIPTENPKNIIEQLSSVGLLTMPVGDVVTVKACDFCEGEKTDPIPYAEEIQKRFGGEEMPKELKIGINGCGMACYNSVMEDIGIVYRKGKFDVFLGAKTVGRTAHPGQLIEEGLEADKLLDLLEKILTEYKENAHPNERLFKYFKRKKVLAGYEHQDIEPKLNLEPIPCAD
jgi:precorrin-3B C17-methyltransferase